MPLTDFEPTISRKAVSVLLTNLSLASGLHRTLMENDTNIPNLMTKGPIVIDALVHFLEKKAATVDT